MVQPQFEPGTLIFGKVKVYTPWPAMHLAYLDDSDQDDEDRKVEARAHQPNILLSHGLCFFSEGSIQYHIRGNLRSSKAQNGL